MGAFMWKNTSFLRYGKFFEVPFLRKNGWKKDEKNAL